MTTYRIIPKRGTYKVEFVDPKGKRWVVGTWRTEEAAVSDINRSGALVIIALLSPWQLIQRLLHHRFGRRLNARATSRCVA